MQTENPGDLNKKDGCGNAPLHIASQEGQTEAVRTLVRLGAQVNQRNQEGRTPLHLAAEAGHKDVVKILLDSGADPRLQDNNGATPSHLAAAEGNMEIMELLTRRSDMKKRIKQLHEAAESGSIKELKKLLESRLPLDEKNERGETALYVATAKGHGRFAEMLLQAGADPNIATNGGSTILHAAAMSGLASIIKKISIYKKSSNGTIKDNKTTSAGDKREKTEQTSKKDTQKEWQDIYKKCESMILKDSGSEEDNPEEYEYQLPVIEEYLESLFSPDKSEQQLEAMRNFLKGLLKNLGKRMDVRSNMGRGATLLHLAAVCQVEDTVRILLKRKADVKARNKDGVTPLIMACAGGSLEIVKILVEAGADPKDADDLKRTGLHYAVRTKSLPLTKYLLSLGVNPNAQDINGNTPLHIASLFKAGADFIAALCDAGGDRLARNRDRLYPFSLAHDAPTFKLLQPPGVDFEDIITPFIL